MPFIKTYNEANQILKDIGRGKCKGSCKTIWLRNIRYAIKTKTNPLKLSKKERIAIKKTIKNVSSKNAANNHIKTFKKYKNRNSPPFSANKNCGKIAKGNDGNNYKSIPNKNNVSSWKKM
jgi:hypothetical protein